MGLARQVPAAVATLVARRWLHSNHRSITRSFWQQKPNYITVLFPLTFLQRSPSQSIIAWVSFSQNLNHNAQLLCFISICKNMIVAKGKMELSTADSDKRAVQKHGTNHMAFRWCAFCCHQVGMGCDNGAIKQCGFSQENEETCNKAHSIQMTRMCFCCCHLFGMSCDTIYYEYTCYVFRHIGNNTHYLYHVSYNNNLFLLPIFAKHQFSSRVDFFHTRLNDTMIMEQVPGTFYLHHIGKWCQ